MYVEIKTPIHYANARKFKYDSANRISYWERRLRLHWMFVLFMGSAALYMSRTILPVVSTTMADELKWDKQSMGTVMGAFFWGYLMTNFIGGYLGDMIGGERVVTVAAVAWAFITMLFPLLPFAIHNSSLLFKSFVFIRILLGCFQGFYFPAVGSLMSHRVRPTERQFTFSIINSGTHMGTLVCGSVGSIMTVHIGWRLPFYCTAIYGFVWAFLTRQFLVSNRQRIIEYRFDLDLVQEVIGTDSTPWRKLLTHSAFWAMLFGHFCHSNCFCILLNWLPSYFHDNFPTARSWVFNVVPWSVTVPSVIFSGWLGDFMMKSNVSPTYIRKFMTTCVLLLSSAFLLLLTATSTYWCAIFLVTACMACNGFHASGILLNPQDVAPKFGGSVFGITNMAGAIPGFLGVYIVGYILDTTKSWNMVFVFTSFVNILGWLVYTIFGTAKRIS